MELTNNSNIDIVYDVDFNHENSKDLAQFNIPEAAITVNIGNIADSSYRCTETIQTDKGREHSTPTLTEWRGRGVSRSIH
jgi:hypothetical protein